MSNVHCPSVRWITYPSERSQRVDELRPLLSDGFVVVVPLMGVRTIFKLSAILALEIGRCPCPLDTHLAPRETAPIEC